MVYWNVTLVCDERSCGMTTKVAISCTNLFLGLTEQLIIDGLCDQKGFFVYIAGREPMVDARSQHCKPNIAAVDLTRQANDVLCQKKKKCARRALFCGLVAAL